MGGLSTAIQQFLTFGFGIYLGRNLTAEDYGLIGILTIFTLINGSVQESGFISALANRKKVDFRDYNAVLLSFYAVRREMEQYRIYIPKQLFCL